jgi:hypothetical protein
MIKNLFARSGFVGLLFTASIFSSITFAQNRAKQVLTPTPNTSIAVLKCCKCIGDEVGPLNLSTGTAAWTVNAPSGGPSSGGIDDTSDNPNRAISASALLAIPASNSAWASGTGVPWIGPVGAVQTSGTYTYAIQFDARKCTIPSSIQISGQFLADNSAQLFVDGVPVAVSIGTANYGFLPASLTPFSYTIPTPLSAGIHTITVKAYNESGPTGISVQLNVTRKCTKDIEVYEGPERD